ncbi:unnamed protein product [Paramecium pentaurelia]|uniref:WD domain, G-beta repeat protein n=1 Tax=Paramecium pentaurelia TaxID=43138 RepID=A0A8S1YEL0_9CILI|nr:unnamed protein product [Paramecium pentaurelia]
MELENSLLCKHNLQALKIINDSNINTTQRLLCHQCLKEHQNKSQLSQLMDISIAISQVNKSQSYTSKYTNQLIYQSITHLNAFIIKFKLLQTEIQEACQQINLIALQWLQDLQLQQNKLFIERFDQSFNNQQSINDNDLNDVNYKFLSITAQYLPDLNSLINPFISFQQFNSCQQILLQLSKVNIEDAIQQLYVEYQCKTLIEKKEIIQQNSICDQEFINIQDMIVHFQEQNKGIQLEIIEQLQSLIGVRQKLSQSIHNLELELNHNIFQQYGNYFQIVQNQNLLINQGCMDKFNEILNKTQKDQMIIMKEQFKSKLKNCVQDVLTNHLKDLQKLIVQEQKLNNFISLKQIISQIKQNQYCYAIQFNKDTTIMISTSSKQIKVWEFNKGQLILRNNLQKHIDDVTCLLYSNYLNSFISGCGNDDGSIVCWQMGNNYEWKSSQPFQQHKLGLRCMIMNHEENQLITGSLDKTIIIWKLDFKQNNLVYQYTLQKHQNKLLSLSINDSETCFVSCSEDQSIIIWIKQQNIWKFKQILQQSIYDIGRQIKFLSDTQFIWLQQNQGILHFFEGQNFQFEEIIEKQLILNNQKQDWNLFPIIYNKLKNIIVIRYNSTVFILRIQQNGYLKIMADPIQCQSEFIYGSLSKDGQYIVLWDMVSKQYNIYEILD